MPFAPSFDKVFRDVIEPALPGFHVFRADSRLDERGILEKIMCGIAECDLVIADVSSTNPNVMYELGVAHALGKPTVMLAQSVLDLPFDIRSYPVHEYSHEVSTAPRVVLHLQELAELHLAGLVDFSNPVTDFLPRVAAPQITTADKTYSPELCAADVEWSSEQMGSFFQRFNRLLSTHSEQLVAATLTIRGEGRRPTNAAAESPGIRQAADATRQFTLELNDLTENFHEIWRRFSRSLLWLLTPPQRAHLNDENANGFSIRARESDLLLNEILGQLAELRRGTTLFPDWSGNLTHALATERDAISCLLNEIMTAKAYLYRISKASSRQS